METNKRFKYKEFFVSKKKPNYMDGVDIDCSIMDIIKLGVESVLDPIANAIAEEFSRKVPILISSGYRTPALNISVGGSLTSDHVTANAVDYTIDMSVIKSVELKDIVLERLPALPFRQLISYNRKPHLHVAWNIPGKEYKREVFTL